MLRLAQARHFAAAVNVEDMKPFPIAAELFVVFLRGVVSKVKPKLGGFLAVINAFIELAL